MEDPDHSITILSITGLIGILITIHTTIHTSILFSILIIIDPG